MVEGLGIAAAVMKHLDDALFIHDLSDHMVARLNIFFLRKQEVVEDVNFPRSRVAHLNDGDAAIVGISEPAFQVHTDDAPFDH